VAEPYVHLSRVDPGVARHEHDLGATAGRVRVEVEVRDRAAGRVVPFEFGDRLDALDPEVLLGREPARLSLGDLGQARPLIPQTGALDERLGRLVDLDPRDAHLGGVDHDAR
jgi:hypothetical protein